ncbi:MAG: SpoIIIAH-like family protein [Clostridiaceae bacterium]|nr:SpoIIIAH-like family protein [Clostridiaceae bacterium]
MALKKKGAVYSVVALMLCVAVYLNWSYNRDDEGYSSVADFEKGKMLGEATLVDGETDTGDTQQVSGDYFSEARLSRQKARDEAVSILNTTIENKSAGDEAAQQANAAIQVMAQSAMQESRIENLVIAKGYADCVVFVNDSGINVIVSKVEGGLQDSDVAKITEIVMDESGVEAASIKIIETT